MTSTPHWRVVGQERRLARARIHRQVIAREVSMTDVLDRPGPELATMTVLDLLQWQHRWGAARARAVLDGVCSEFARVGDLTLRQRAEICQRLEVGTADLHWHLRFGPQAEEHEAA